MTAIPNGVLALDYSQFLLILSLNYLFRNGKKQKKNKTG